MAFLTDWDLGINRTAFGISRFQSGPTRTSSTGSKDDKELIYFDALKAFHRGLDFLQAGEHGRA
jgi:hypothetical protein